MRSPLETGEKRVWRKGPQEEAGSEPRLTGEFLLEWQDPARAQLPVLKELWRSLSSASKTFSRLDV